MNIILWILGGLVLLIISFVVYRMIAFKRAGASHLSEQLKRIEPLMAKLHSGAPLSTTDVTPFAHDNRSRCATYELLKASNQVGLFPEELVSFEKAGEGRLVNWLEFPTELGAVPNAIEHVERVAIPFDGKEVFYHVFKYMTHEPHWAAKNGWMLGVVGPYLTDSEPYDPVSATFSRCDIKFGEITPKQEAQWVHDHIALRR